ncbi:hypothetical protein KX477_24115, partial [Escherichia coli]|nr:hypothetical protein [Escherichia coli]MCD3917395.1 hypothetical protein [Escherichia coli]
GSCGDSVRAPMALQSTTKISAQHVSPVIFQSSLPTICHIVNASGDFCCQFFHPYRVTLIILNKTKYPEYIYFLLVPET